MREPHQGPQEPHHDSAECILALRNLTVDWPDPRIEISKNLFLQKVDADYLNYLRHAGIKEPEQSLAGAVFCIHSVGTCSTADLLRPSALVTALTLTSNIHLEGSAQIVVDHSPRKIAPVVTSPGEGPLPFRWGHYDHTVTRKAMAVAATLLPGIAALQAPEQYTRVSNALRFYGNGFIPPSADLALIAFSTCLESLFSTETQEISFRLALRVAMFLADDPQEREGLYRTAKDVYAARSKVVHGARLMRDEEQAAIYLVEHVVPKAESLARSSLAKILTMGLEAIFNNPGKLNTLFETLLFRSHLTDALASIRS